jgi:hypothetical protein
VYWDEEFHKNLKAICKREGISVSIKSQQLQEPYVENHKEGNPQTMLDYAEQPLCLPKWKTCIRSGKKMVGGTFLCRMPTGSFWKTADECGEHCYKGEK